MFQYSVYIRFCGSRKAAEFKISRVRKLVPDSGRVSMLMVTDKQFGQIVNIFNSINYKVKKTEELTLF